MTEALLEAIRTARKVTHRARRRPLDFVPWMPMQLAFLAHGDRGPCLLRLGNRQGKSYAGAALLCYVALGHNPHGWAPEPPTRSALICDSKAQSVEIQRLIWEHLGGADNYDLTEEMGWNPRTGFGGHRPVIQFRNGSTITCYTNSQGAIALAGAEFDGVILLDEPPAQEVYDEALARTLNTQGRLALTLTPINGPPLPWLRALTEAAEDGTPPQVTDYHSRLTPESQVSPLTNRPRLTKDGRVWDAAYIASIEASTNPIDAPIRVHGEWESRTEGQFFCVFDPTRHVFAGNPRGKVRLVLGVDYAAADRELGMCAVLSAYRVDLVKDASGKEIRQSTIWALDEVVVPGATTMEQFAAAILRRLDALGIRWHELDEVWGDQPAKSRYTTASNLHLHKHVARLVGTPVDGLRPRVLSVKEGGGSSSRSRRTKDIRCRWTYGEIAADRVYVHERCQTLQKALQEWDYDDRHQLKDILDGWMYGLRSLWVESPWRSNLPHVRWG